MLKRRELAFSATTALEGAGGSGWILVVRKVWWIDVFLLCIARSSLCPYAKRWSIISHIVVILLIWLAWRGGIIWLLGVLIVCLILEIHWVMCLIIKKSFALKEVLSTIKSWLLLHLLEAILIWCSVVFVILVLIFKVRYVVLSIHVSCILDIILALWAVVLVTTIAMSLISGWTPVALRNSINVSTKKVATLRAYGAAGCSWSTRRTGELLVVFLYGLIWILVLIIASH